MDQMRFKFDGVMLCVVQFIYILIPKNVRNRNCVLSAANDIGDAQDAAIWQRAAVITRPETPGDLDAQPITMAHPSIYIPPAARPLTDLE
ncbi:hypothetical protein EVAR_81608_1 [Eumeta japonica]|uniref:Uncharacterized protein n=1 Tax=Eumeta variegata TaxID=151549 RepID=A0A4C1WCD0_EUMVA|nr:hypothetical protein EVAR_81608_1 [Eumeta japonica]